MACLLNTGLLILYTQNIRGNFDLLPRLFTFLQGLKKSEIARNILMTQHLDIDDKFQAVTRPRFLLLDLGNACAPEVWHCAVTGGRSALIVLDAMGYHAAHVSGFLAPESREKLADNLMQLALVDTDHDWEHEGIWVMGKDNPDRKGNLTDRPYNLRIILNPHTATELNGNTLRLAAVEAGQVGTAHLHIADSGVALLSRYPLATIPPNTPPDPTIAGTVDFVLGEARYFQQKNE